MKKTSRTKGVKRHKRDWRLEVVDGETAEKKEGVAARKGSLEKTVMGGVRWTCPRA